MKRLRIIDSTTITLFSNLLFKGVGRHPKTGKKKGGMTVTNDSFMLRPSTLGKGDIVAMDCAYIDYEKLKTLT